MMYGEQGLRAEGNAQRTDKGAGAVPELLRALLELKALETCHKNVF